MSKNEPGMKPFVCIRPCFRDNVYYTPGDGKVVYSDKESVPHFQPLEVAGRDAEDLVVNRERYDRIRKAMYSLDPTNNALWTTAGLPRIEEVEKRCGLNLTRADITEVDPNFSRGLRQQTMKEVKPDLMG